MTFPRQIFLLALSAFMGLVLTGCQPSDPDSPKVAVVTSIAVTPNPVNLEIGGVRSLTVTGTFSDDSTFVVNFGTTFASSAPAVATVARDTGYVTAIAAGSATITATHADSGKTATTTVSVSPLRVLSIAVSPATSTLAPGASQALTVTATYNNATTGPETGRSTFVSSNPAVALVDATGIVTAVAVGTATITATHTASGKTGTAAVAVSIGGGGGGFTNITFDSAGVVYTLTGFGGAAGTLVPDPTDGSNIVAQVVKSATAEPWAGVTVSTGDNQSVGKIPFTSTSTKMTVRVYSPRAGIPVRLKVEDAADNTRTVETEALTKQVNAWETLTFDFANQASGTAALNLAYTYNKVSIFFDFGKTGAAGGAGTFLFDDVAFPRASGNTGTCTDPCIDFASASVKYEPFEGLVSAAQSDDPVDATNKVAQFVKGPTGQPWAGATIYTIDATKSVPKFDLSGSKIVTLRVYSPMVGMNVRLKLEDAANNAIYLEKDVLTTKANDWETLSFDFATPVNGVFNPANTYNRVSLFPAFSTTAPPASNVTVYFDELDYTTSGGGGATAPTDAPTTVIPAGSVTIYSDAASVTGLNPFPDWGQSPPVTSSEVTIAGNKSLKYVWAGPGGLYQGIDWSSNPVDVSAKTKLHIDFWTPDLASVKVSIISAGKENAYTQALTKGGWNGVDIDLSNYTVPDKAAIIQIKLEPATPGTLYVDNVYFWGTAGGGSGSCGTTAPDCAPTTIIPADAVTIYSDAASRTGLDPFPFWGQSPPVTSSEVTIAGNKSLQYVWAGPGGLYQGIDWSSNPVDVSAKGKLHIDFWTPNVGSVKVSIISAGRENAYTQALTTGGWNGVDIDLSNYTVPNLAAIIQIKLEPNAPGTLYVDNVYFWGTAGGGSGSCGTTAPDCAPTTIIPADAVTIYSDAASRTGLDPFPFWGQSPPVTSGEVIIAGNKSLQYVWAGPGGLYQGIDWSSNPVDVSAKGKLHIDFWTPDVGSVKVSVISAGRENAVTQTLTTGGWNSVDIDLSNYPAPNLAAIIQIKLEPNAPGTLYVDNIYFWGTAAGSTGCTGGTFTGGIFAADYRGDLDPAAAKPPLTTLCGDIGFFYDSRFAVGTTAQFNFGGISNQAVNPGGINNFYYGFGLKLPAITDGYFGAYVNAPANGIADVTSFTNLRFTLWGPAELFEKSFTPKIQVVMAGPAVAGCGSNSGRSEVQAPLVTAQKIGAASNYVVPLSSFTIKFACSGESTVAQILAKVAQVNFSLIGTNIQYSVPDTSTPPAYSNGLNVGPISFN